MAKPSLIQRTVLGVLDSLFVALSSNAAVAATLRRQAILAYFEPTFPRPKVRVVLNRLRSRGYIRIEHDVIHLTPEGHKRAQAYQLESLTLDTSQVWDGRWRVIIWDIPERSRSKRDRVRALLRQLHFVRIQRSIWVTPYPCKDQITYIREQLEITSGLIYMEADMIEGAQKLRYHFHLQQPASVKT